MSSPQPGILSEIPEHACYLTFNLPLNLDFRVHLQALLPHINGDDTVIGIGQPLVAALEQELPGLRHFPDFSGKSIAIPSTQAALWLWLRSDNRGDLFHRARKLAKFLVPGFELIDWVEAFQYKDNKDLTGYQNSYKNPTGDAAIEAAISTGIDTSPEGSSFVAVQQWQHNYTAFSALSAHEKDRAIGRTIKDNKEIEDAPLSAHTKRTAQDDFYPEAYLLRRSMPWCQGNQSGLMFVAFGKSFNAFERQMKRMSGAEDGISDALLNFSRPLNGSYFWCPPIRNGSPDLHSLRL